MPYCVPRYQISLVCEATYPVGALAIRDSPTAAAAALWSLFDGLDREQFAVCCLDAKHHIIGVNVVSVGSLTLSIVPPEFFKPAILLNAAALLCAYNHPSSGNPTPCPEDRALTVRHKTAGEQLRVKLLDHLILGDARSYSFADRDWPG